MNFSSNLKKFLAVAFCAVLLCVAIGGFSGSVRADNAPYAFMYGGGISGSLPYYNKGSWTSTDGKTYTAYSNCPQLGSNPFCGTGNIVKDSSGNYYIYRAGTGTVSSLDQITAYSPSKITNNVETQQTPPSLQTGSTDPNVVVTDGPETPPSQAAPSGKIWEYDGSTGEWKAINTSDASLEISGVQGENSVQPETPQGISGGHWNFTNDNPGNPENDSGTWDYVPGPYASGGSTNSDGTSSGTSGNTSSSGRPSAPGVGPVTGSSIDPFEYAQQAKTVQGALAGQLLGTGLKVAANVGVNAAMGSLTSGAIAAGTAAQTTWAAAALPVNTGPGSTAEIVTAAHTVAANTKTFSLDGIAKMIAETMVHQIAISIVNWINTGFNGNPAFITDLAGFMQSTADTATTDFINNSGLLQTPYGPLIAQALVAGQNATFSQSIQPVWTGALADANQLNSFMGGNFYAGGWQGWYDLTQRPQNNYMGAYQMSSQELSNRISSAQNVQQKQLDWGQGFQSKTVCDGTYIPKAADGSGGSFSCNHQSIATPGTVIRESLNQAVNSDLVTLENVHDINEIVNALMGQLINYVTTNVDGLAGASQPTISSTDAKGNPTQVSLLDSLNSNVDSDTLANLKNPILTSIETTISKVKDPNLVPRYTTVLNKAEDAGAALNDLMLCYQVKLDPTYNPPLSGDEYALAYSRFAETQNASTTLDSIIANQIQYFIDFNASQLADLQNIEAQVQNATDLTQLNDIIAHYQALYPNETGTGTTQTDTKALGDQMDNLESGAKQRLDECKIFPATQ